jgi:clan AA aspartic protease
VQATIENTSEREFAERGLWSPARVKAIELEMLVDTGSTLVVLPEPLVNRLGMRLMYRTPSVLADGTVIETWIAGGATMTVGDRSCSIDCVVAPAGSPALIGQVALEVLDFLVDCRNRQLVGRHPGGRQFSMY